MKTTTKLHSIKREKRWGTYLTYVVIVLLSAVFIAPLLWILSTSVKPDKQIFSMPPVLIPHPITFNHYIRAFTELPFFLYLRNTLIIVIFSTLGVTISSSLVAFSISRLRWPDRTLVFFILLATIMLPPQVTMIPIFILFRQLGWIDTLLPLIVPFFFGNAFFIFLLRQFFLTLPGELIESARIDGAGNFRIFLQIFVPLSKPAILTVILFSSMWAWNDFMGPLIYLSSEKMKTLALGLASLQSQYGTEWGMLMAAASVMTVPIIILFFFAQRYFIEGIALTGLKG
ncbi:carbohydrate ABC transporter permease [Candidatus Sumerlaeota bacterium]|nr:carbohydrate ABC transporter permease [Candidatus Sumerlaeota bacterium]